MKNKTITETLATGKANIAKSRELLITPTKSVTDRWNGTPEGVAALAKSLERSGVK